MDEILIGLGYDYNEKDSKAFLKSTKDIGNGILSIGKVLSASVAGLFAMVTAMNAINGATDATADTLDITDSKLKALQNTASEFGLDKNSLVTDAKKFQEFIDNLKIGKLDNDLAEQMSFAGIDWQSATSGADLLRKSIEGLNKVQDPGKRRAFTKNLLSDANAIRLVNAGYGAMIKHEELLRKMGYARSKEAIKNTQEYNNELTKTATIFKSISDSISDFLTKYVTPLLKQFNEFASTNLGDMRKDLRGWTADLVGGKENLDKIISTMKGFQQGFENIINTSLEGWKMLIKLIKEAFSEIEKFFNIDVEKSVKNMFGDLFSTDGKGFEGWLDNLKKGTVELGKMLPDVTSGVLKDAREFNVDGGVLNGNPNNVYGANTSQVYNNNGSRTIIDHRRSTVNITTNNETIADNAIRNADGAANYDRAIFNDKNRGGSF